MDEARSLTFGRGPGADVRFPHDPHMSPVHCRITQGGGHMSRRFFAEDLGSTNGVWIIRISGTSRQMFQVSGAAVLESGDQVMIGRTVLPWRAD